MRKPVLKGRDLAREVLDLGLEALDFVDLLRVRAEQLLMLLPPVRDLLLQLALVAVFSLAICSL